MLRMSLGLGVEQGLAMELAVSVGVVLNNEVRHVQGRSQRWLVFR